MKITPQHIKQIAGELQSGMKVYLNREDLEIRAFFDMDDLFDDEEFEDEELEKIEEEWSDYMVLTQMESRESYRIMERFAAGIKDKKYQEYIFKILDRKSPFANFKAEIESSAYREQWFDFRDKSYEAYVRTELEMEEFDFE